MGTTYRGIWLESPIADPPARLERLRLVASRWALEDPDATPLEDGVVELDTRFGDRSAPATKVLTASMPAGGPDGFLIQRRDTPPETDPDQTVSLVEIRAVLTPDGVCLLVDGTLDSSDPAGRRSPGCPSVVRLLLDGATSPHLGRSSLVPGVITVDAGTVHHLVADLCHPERTLPFVVFSHPRDRGTRRDQLADEVFVRTRGVANVVCLDEGATARFHERLGSLSVWGGGVRVYVPAALAETSDGWRHRYVVGSQVRDHGPRTVNQIVDEVTALSARRRVPELLVDALSVLSPGEHSSAVEIERLLLDWEEQLESERDERARLEHQLNELSGRLSRLQERMRDAGLEAMFWDAYSPSADDLPTDAATVSDAVLQAQIFLAEWVSIPDEAVRELEGIDTAPTARAWGNATWRGLRAFAEYAKAKRAGFVGGFETWCRDSGDPLAWPASSKKLAMRESDTVMSNRAFRSRRMFPVDTSVDRSGQVLMQAHLKVSQGGGDLAPRVYFFDDTDHERVELRKVHVGLVGPHFLVPNTKT